MKSSPQTVSVHLKQLIDLTIPKLLALSESQVSLKRNHDTWSKKEILGHLIDSAANNHQRFVRLQETKNLGTFGYTQTQWVSAQGYQTEDWKGIVELWKWYNLHLAHIIAQIKPEFLDNICDMGYSKPASLGYVIEDYVRHLEHHVEQLLSREDPANRKKWVRREPE